ncbi:alpha/beta hydrolase [Roseibacillus persicicus]|uniref:Carboxylesterase n=1 Tax=Roseibacillus persicicus TaxID=454148 RepID=A0A918TEM9_9BACT|nr:alpha/beta fold hydrolase [Roseibacillus persicicus]GHC44949.1 carboxylesterase [Roseibacillus persicicus]
MPSALPFLEFGADRDTAEVTVLMLHGLGADGHDFADVAHMICEAARPQAWRFVLPHAETIPVTINMGMTMPAWYDILALSHPRAVDWETVTKSEQQIEELLRQEKAGKVFLAGFSQGAAMALQVGLKNQNSIAGILALSGYLLEDDSHPVPSPARDIPVGLFHGDDDEVVPLQAAQESFASLKANRYSPSLKIYPHLGHSVNQAEVQDLFEWLIQHS